MVQKEQEPLQVVDLEVCFGYSLNFHNHIIQPVNIFECTYGIWQLF